MIPTRADRLLIFLEDVLFTALTIWASWLAWTLL